MAELSPRETKLESPLLLKAPWRRWLFLAAFAVAVPVPAALVAFGRDQGAWVLVIAGAVGMLMTRLEDVESFTLGPLKAELRKQIDRAKDAAERANATVEQLRKLALAVAPPLLNTLVTPRFGDGPSPSQYTDRDRIVEQLRALGVPADTIEEALVRWTRRAEMDHLDAIHEAVGKVLRATPEMSVQVLQRAPDDPDPDEVKRATSHKFFSEIRERLWKGGGEAPAAAEVARFVREQGINGPEVSEAVADLEHFQKHKTLRRPDAFGKGSAEG